MAIAIQVENLSKAYQLGEIGTGTLSRDIERWLAKIRGKEDPFLKIGEANDRTSKGTSDVVWSLKDINFEIEQGDAVGIIGRNGAGKSTLLKLLSRVTSPTTGTIKVKGRIASLLEVGTGFHPELTGKENIYLNGAILGMRKKEIRRKFDEIVDFAGVERYIDTPVKRYSSGMYVRLAFAVAAYLESEILIVDEVLAVGDAEFQKKCLGKMNDVSKGEGRTVLFVSHNMNSIRTLCNRGVILENGRLSVDKEVNTAINYYEKNNENSTYWKGEDGDKFIKITETKVLSNDGKKSFSNSSTLNISLQIKLLEAFNDLVIGLTIKSSYGYPIASTLYNDFNDYSLIKAGLYEIIFTIPSYTLAHGSYIIDFNVSIPYVRKINSNIINLKFNIIADSSLGNKFFVENNYNYNSIIRPNWFKSIKEIHN